MVNFYDHKEVKDLIFDLMIENRELKQQVERASNSIDNWYRAYKEQKAIIEQLRKDDPESDPDA